MSTNYEIPETRVLAIASHVVYGYVGNTMATFVLQSLGCEVSAINTVHYSNHTAYKQVKGRKTTAEEISELYEGLKQSNLTDFDVLLTGYTPSAEAVEAVGRIGRDLKFHANTKPGSFFWVLDPVMGDEGRLYIPEEEVPVYKTHLRNADLILPNQFEAELLSDTKIRNLDTLAEAIQILHRTHQIPHIVITSLRFTESGTTVPYSADYDSGTLTIVGSTARADHTPRLFRIDIPAFPVFFSGTGDMFAALTVARLRGAVFEAGVNKAQRWVSPDDVPSTELPLAKAAEEVLASMQAVLRKTYAAWDKERKLLDEEMGDVRAGQQSGKEGMSQEKMRRHLRLTKAAEVKLVRNVDDLRHPPDSEKYKAQEVIVHVGQSVGQPQPDELGITNLGGEGSQSAIHIDNTNQRN
ncbi:putative pyridoxal kinase [Coniosporium tulheliwenetii]|uniref:Pyridoxal kinase n=1 Tax=Coniosporium tulheliwenetii TaxID=3383036 RepID=A0ACC2ZLG6_9PEZI|nr:putative pyridoxal kinase [Cladosporium sp. JES 115]